MIALFAFSACGGPGKADTRVQRLVDVYVPAIKIGEGVTPALRSQRHLEVVE